MTTPIERRIMLVVPDEFWRKALKSLADKRGISVSKYICDCLATAVYKELRDGQN